ncbi:MAG: hypothetical protein BWY86_01204 [Candidatus Aminicenantes bacterium ADurb.Bin508]|nr:MAG: hypothetical protein BWY86_01204 [Candidatus Aminicenantes bacterium ADurb.Bin508]
MEEGVGGEFQEHPVLLFVDSQSLFGVLSLGDVLKDRDDSVGVPFPILQKRHSIFDPDQGAVLLELFQLYDIAVGGGRAASAGLGGHVLLVDSDEPAKRIWSDQLGEGLGEDLLRGGTFQG